jgi:hypothetical protein
MRRSGRRQALKRQRRKCFDLISPLTFVNLIDVARQTPRTLAIGRRVSRNVNYEAVQESTKFRKSRTIDYL